MELHLNPEQETRLRKLALRTGRKLEQVLEHAVDRMLDYDEQFLAAVGEGRSAARRGELLEHDEVVQRIENVLRS